MVCILLAFFFARLGKCWLYACKQLCTSDARVYSLGEKWSTCATFTGQPLLWLLHEHLPLISAHFFPPILKELTPVSWRQIKAFFIQDTVRVIICWWGWHHCSCTTRNMTIRGVGRILGSDQQEDRDSCTGTTSWAVWLLGRLRTRDMTRARQYLLCTPRMSVPKDSIGSCQALGGSPASESLFFVVGSED